MVGTDRFTNIIMGGGGVKGIAYIGVFDAMEKMGFRGASIAGVSAGSLAGSLSAAGYDSAGMWRVMEEFDFEGVQMEKIPQKVPAVAWFTEYAKSARRKDETIAADFLTRRNTRPRMTGRPDERGHNVFSNIITYCKEGCLYDGDLLEEWMRKSLAQKGIRTFGDLRGAKADSCNPGGYKVRMTGVDCNRARVIVLPDDMTFYGIEPDDFEVAKAVRISTSVPFAFKPVEIKVNADGKTNTYSLVDGGVLDSFPDWLIDCSAARTAGFKLNGGEKKFFSLDTPMNALKSLISSVHDIGVPKQSESKLKDIEVIDVSRIQFLDFNLSQEDKIYMYNAGRDAAARLFSKFGAEPVHSKRALRPPRFRGW